MSAESRTDREREHTEREFHAAGGWHFSRFDNGVGVVLRDKDGDSRDTQWFDEDTWASIVAFVSARGENSETFHEALAFHNARPSTERQEPPK